MLDGIPKHISFHVFKGLEHLAKIAVQLELGITLSIHLGGALLAGGAVDLYIN